MRQVPKKLVAIALIDPGRPISMSEIALVAAVEAKSL
jgi:hypothetical protein